MNFNSKVFIPISQNKVLMIDYSDYELVKQYTWCAHRNHNVYYAETNMLKIHGKSKSLQVHRLLLNSPRGMVIDHIDGNGLNNCRDNLRVVSPKVNQWNRSKLDPDRGIYQRKSGKWQAQLSINSKNKYLGIFDSKEKAQEEIKKQIIKTRGVEFLPKTKDNS